MLKNKSFKKICMVITLLFSYVLPFVKQPVLYAISENPTVTVGELSDVVSNVTKDGQTFQDRMGFIYADGEIVFCVDPRTIVDNGRVYNTGSFSQGEIHDSQGNTLTQGQVEKIKSIIFWGWDMSDDHSLTQYVKVQGAIYKALGYDFDRMSSQVDSADVDTFISEIDAHATRTLSFDNQTITLKPGESTTLTDTNGNLQYLEFANKNGWEFSKNGNTLTITATENAKNTIVATKNFKLYKQAKTSLLLTSNGSQTVVAFKDPDRLLATLTLNVEERKGHIRIVKTDAQTGEALQGVEFALFEKGGTKELKVALTNEQGIAEFRDLAVKEYDVREVLAKTGYELNPQTLSVTVEADKTATLTATNVKKGSLLKIVKVDAETQETIAVAGVSFQVYKDNQPISMNGTDTFVTDSTGTITLPEKLPVGSYLIKEVKAPTGYVLSKEAISVVINGKETTVTVTVKNNKQKGQIWLSKRGFKITAWNKLENGVYLAETDSVLLGGATFRFTNTATQAQFELTTVDGEVLKTAELPLGTYEVVELTAPNGYVKDNTVHTVTLTAEDPAQEVSIESLSVYNTRQSLTVNVTKEFETSEKGQEAKATIGIFSAEDYTENNVTLPKDTLIGLKEVTGTSSITFDNIPSQMKVYAKEISTSQAYTLNEEKFQVTPGKMSDTGKISSEIVTIKNALKRGEYSFVKVDSSSKEPLAKAEFKLVSILSDGSEREVGLFTSDDKGLLSFKNLEFGKYYTQETKAPAGYFLNAMKHFFEVNGISNATNMLRIENERIPSIVTEATALDGGKVVYKHEKIKEVARFDSLVPGKEYEAVATMYTSKGEVLATQKRMFTAKAIQHEEVFFFDVPVKHVGDTVFGEELYRDGEKVAVHFDLTNKHQTVTVLEPTIGTIAKIGGQKQMTVGEKQELVDTLTYKQFKHGKVIVLAWLVKYGTDDMVVKPVEKVVELNGDGEVAITLDTIDVSKLPVGKYTILEQVFEVDENGNVGKLISEHTNNKNEQQSFTIVEKAKLPKTGEDDLFALVLIGLAFVLCGIVLFLQVKTRQMDRLNDKEKLS
ncbi:VaFE repeat-containing surface-anchored protein [Carnobacteriaceae bacterium zg-ZUI78]|nr:VaFE repeat-containing surface-anchored protein [Carnobacteriaceae bacterium zg-ZUI78]